MYFAKHLGVKTMYYHNTKIKDAQDISQGCSGGGCEVYVVFKFTSATNYKTKENK